VAVTSCPELDAEVDGAQLIKLVDSTPSGAANIALSHLFDNVDLVLSGPNFGPNVGRLYGLSSGTLGAAMEGATMGYPAIAVSFDIPSKSYSPTDAQCEGATEAAIGVIESLWAEWGKAECYNVNVPLDATRDTPGRLTHFYRDNGGALFEKSFENTTASVPFMITKAMKAKLAASGHATAQVAKMKPQEAHDLL